MRNGPRPPGATGPRASAQPVLPERARRELCRPPGMYERPASRPRPCATTSSASNSSPGPPKRTPPCTSYKTGMPGPLLPSQLSEPNEQYKGPPRRSNSPSRAGPCSSRMARENLSKADIWFCLAGCHVEIGKVQLSEGDVDAALESFQRAMDIIEEVQQESETLLGGIDRGIQIQGVNLAMTFYLQARVWALHSAAVGRGKAELTEGGGRTAPVCRAGHGGHPRRARGRYRGCSSMSPISTPCGRARTSGP